MESSNYSNNYVETELSESIVLIEDLTDPNGDKIEQLCDSAKVYHSCYVHRRDDKSEDDNNDPGEAIALTSADRGTPDGKSDTDIDEEDENQDGNRDFDGATFSKDQVKVIETLGVKIDEKLEKIILTKEIDGREDETEYDGEEDDEEDEEEEEIEVRIPQCSGSKIDLENFSAESNSNSECESKSTVTSYIDDSFLITVSQPTVGIDQVESNGLTSSEFFDLDEDKTDYSSYQELPNDNDQPTMDEVKNDNKYGICNPIKEEEEEEGYDTVDNQQINSKNSNCHRNLKGKSEEKLGLLSVVIEDQLGPIEDYEEDEIEINCKPLMYLDNPLISTDLNDDQVSLITKHSTYSRHGIKLNGGGTSTSCSASASSASTSSISSRTIARRMVRSSGKAVKSFSKKLSKLFK